VELIINARHVYVIGMRSAYSLAWPVITKPPTRLHTSWSPTLTYSVSLRPADTRDR
jgi:hypothetical protein